MKQTVTDIDIDTPDRDKVLELFPHTVAASYSNKKPARHNTGVYFHKIPRNPTANNICNIDYKKAEQLGYFKVDVLNVGLYKGIKDSEHMDKLLAIEPIWELLEEKEFCDLLFHIRGYHNVCKQMKPNSVEKLAAILAMIRPAKKHLIGLPWNIVFNEIWTKSTVNGYAFKKAHAFSYSMAVILHMNLLVEQFRLSV